MPVSFDVTRATALQTDGDGDGKADPGDTLRTTVTIHNTGDTAGLGASYTDLLGGSTLTGSVNVSPIAFNDSFTAVGNTVLRVGGAANIGSGPSSQVAGNLMANDASAAGDGVTGFHIDTVTNGTSAHGGIFNINSDGSFNYESKAGDSGTDSFTYTIRDAGLDHTYNTADDLTSTATVSITLTGKVWYVDGSAGAGGDGTSSNPFNSMAQVNGVTGDGTTNDDVDGSGDYIYVKGTPAGSIVLEAGEQLIGTGSALTVGGFGLATAGSNSTLTATTGNVITLGTDNTIQGVTINANGAGVVGMADGSASVTTSGGTLNVSSVTFTGTGQSIDIDQGGNLNMSINSLTSSGSANQGVQFAGTASSGTGLISGTVSITGGAISNSTGDGILIGTSGGVTASAGGNLSVSYGGTISNAGAASVEVQDKTGGTDTFSGNITDGTNASGAQILADGNSNATLNFTGQTITLNGAANGVSYTNNSGGTLNISPLAGGNGLDITTTTGTGFNASGGGTVNVTGSGNSINSSSATALTVSNTSIGSSGLVFHDITAGNNTAASDPVNGIVLNNTGTSASNGGLTITGDGTNNGSGGTIQHTTGDGISLINTKDVNLAYLNVTGNLGDGIHGETITNLSLNHVNVTSNGDSTSDDGIQLGLESGSSTIGVTGTLTITNSDVSGNAHNNFHLRDASGTLSTVTVTGSSFNNLNDTYGANSFLLEMSGTSNLTSGTITGNTFQNNSPQRGLEIQAHDTANIGNATGNGGLSISGNTFIDNGIQASFTQDGSANLTFHFVNNGTAAAPMTGAILQAINVFSSSQSTGGAIFGTISGNFIGNSGVAGSGSTQGSGIRILVQGQTDSTLLVDNNSIQQIGNTTGSRGIDAEFLGPTQTGLGTTSFNDITITNNTITSAPASTFPLAAIYVAADDQGSPSKVRADIHGNTVPGTGSYDYATFDGNGAQIIFNVTESSGLPVPTAQLLDTGAASANATAQLASANSTTFAYADSNVGLITGTINTPPASLIVDPSVLPTVDPTQDPSTGGTTPPTDGGSTGDTATAGDGSTGGSDTSTGPTVVDDGVLTQAELNLIVNAAIDRWAAAGATDAQLAAMRATVVTVADLGGQEVGEATAGHIAIDSNAAGFSWFVDATPGDDSEFGGTGTDLHAPEGTLAAARIDLLTTVMHELGHQVGLVDEYSSSDSGDLMYAVIDPGERRLPTGHDIAGATGVPVTETAFSLSPVSIGTIPVGQTVTLQWDSTVNAYTGNTIVPTYNNTGTLSGSNFGDVTSNTETLSGSSAPVALDTLTLGDRVFADTNFNGVLDAGETGIANVHLTLFADDGTTPGQWDANDTQLATTTTDGNGFYNFGSLAQGDYIVQVDSSNFGAGGALQTAHATLPGAADPDNNVDSDNNGVAGGGLVVSLPITLALDSEPGSTSTNNTVDFGFFSTVYTGTPGPDTFAAPTSNDWTIYGLDSADNLTGNAGRDLIDGGGGADTMTGGKGSDIYYVDNPGDTIVELAHSGIDKVYTTADTVLPFQVENATLLAAATVTGNGLANIIIGSTGNDTLNGLGGNDTLKGGDGLDTIYGGDGNDFLSGGGNQDHLFGEGGDDKLNGGLYNDFLYGGDGNDTLIGWDGHDKLFGDAGDDTLKGGDGIDRLYGGDGNDNLSGGGNLDYLYGQAGNDTLDGGLYNDVLDGGTGADTMTGGIGNDHYYVDDPGDTIIELPGGGNDTVYAKVDATLAPEVENLVLQAAATGTGNELANTMTGSIGDDTLYGLSGTDTLFGHGGVDHLYGGDNGDTLDGDGGNDFIYGGDGNDSLTGGAGADRFIFDVTPNAATNMDTIVDFHVGSDRIVLDQSAFSTVGSTGPLDPNAFHAGTTAGDASDRIIYDSGTGNIYYDDDGTGGDAQILFAHVTAGLVLGNTDFGIIA